MISSRDSNHARIAVELNTLLEEIGDPLREGIKPGEVSQ